VGGIGAEVRVRGFYRKREMSGLLRNECSRGLCETVVIKVAMKGFV
jgi:hypothetical protein